MFFFGYKKGFACRPSSTRQQSLPAELAKEIEAEAVKNISAWKKAAAADSAKSK